MRSSRQTQEIALAKSAAPAVVADAAEIWVLGDSGYERAKTGTNGYDEAVALARRGPHLRYGSVLVRQVD